MRARSTSIAFFALGLQAGCVGGLSNEPYLPGTARVEGRFAVGVDPVTAWVVVLGHPDLVSAIDAEGRFAIDDVPTGEVELAASTGLGQAAREELLVLREVENRIELTPVPGATTSGLANLAGEALTRRISVGVEGLPARTLATSTGRFSLGSLPPGCFALRAEHATHQPVGAELCLAPGETSSLDLRLIEDEGGRSDAALCAPCLADSDCASGWCFLHLEEEESERVCSTRCSEDADCPQGFRCEEDELSPGDGACLPHEVSCSARANLGAPCDSIDLCGLGEGDGACLDGLCSFECDTDLDCPDNTRCVEREEAGHTFCLQV